MTVTSGPGRTPKQAKHMTIADAVFALGMVLQAVVSAGPDIVKAFPQAKWIPVAIAASGALLSLWRHYQEQALTGSAADAP